MKYTEKRRQQERTFERAVGVQLAQYGGLKNLPQSVKDALVKRATELGMKFPDDFEIAE